VLIKYLWYTW